MVSVFTLNSVLSAYNDHPGDFTFNGLINFGRFDVSIANYQVLRGTFLEINFCSLIKSTKMLKFYSLETFVV